MQPPNQNHRIFHPPSCRLSASNPPDFMPPTASGRKNSNAKTLFPFKNEASRISPKQSHARPPIFRRKAFPPGVTPLLDARKLLGITEFVIGFTPNATTHRSAANASSVAISAVKCWRYAAENYFDIS